MTLFGMIIFFIVTILWIFIGQLILSHLIDDKGYDISSFWEWNYLWFLGLFELLSTDNRQKSLKRRKDAKYDKRRTA